MERKALLSLRTANHEKYLIWLDAKEIGLTQTQRELEDTVSEIMDYKKIIKAAYTDYDTVKRSAYDQYEETRSSAYETYTNEQSLAYGAYQAAN